MLTYFGEVKIKEKYCKKGRKPVLGLGENQERELLVGTALLGRQSWASEQKTDSYLFVGFLCCIFFFVEEAKLCISLTFFPRPPKLHQRNT